MDTYGKWEIVKELGGGGQGMVYLVKDTQKTGGSPQRIAEIRKAIATLASAQTHQVNIEMGKLLLEAIAHLTPNTIEPSALGALKLLHKPRESAGFEKAKERMKQEVSALSNIKHPNILKILDQNMGDGWFVGEYHARGTLWNQRDQYKGDLVSALEAFKPLVEGVSELHQAKLVHRDIKPHNIFIAPDDRLVLGDLGIVFFDDPARTRITDSYENVGSRDWMPGWAMGMKVEEIRPSFDIFCLGKLLWFMLSGRSLLRLWYLHRDEYELEKMFPNDESIKWARVILDKCIVEHEDECKLSAPNLLDLVDEVLHAVKRHAQVVREGVERNCTVCGIGHYQRIVNENPTDLRNFGLHAVGNSTFKIFTCSHCGHVQMFHFGNRNSKPMAWKN
ncbi:MAG: protein kinase [Deltaproteobacteria bacterium]|nr:protein kinase [Deltaproteobacteria bacterium]